MTADGARCTLWDTPKDKGNAEGPANGKSAWNLFGKS